MTKKNTHITVKQPDSSVESFISQAIASNAPVETLERLFDLRAKVKAEAASEAFVEALGSFQQACPVIRKTKKVLNKDGKSVRYQFAPLDAISAQIRKPMRDSGLSYSWDTKHEEGHMKVTCKITHSLGHFETSMLEIPIDKEGFMTAPQKYASAQTFAKRYTLLNALGITTADEDDDSLSTPKESDAKSIKAKIMLRLRTLKEKTGTHEEVEEAVKRLTQLALEEKNHPEIAARLQTIIDEKNEV
jgi:NADH dehydrogenase/NADH:ubiquinone oxidoreductase subunit G